jgi:hypothetical protein
LLRDADCEKSLVCPWQLPAAFPDPFRMVCSSRRHVVFPAVAFRDDATGLDVLEANVRYVMRAARELWIFLVAVAIHLVGAAI